MRNNFLLIAVLFCMNTSIVVASQPSIFTQPLPNIENYSCKFCPEPEEPLKSIEAGIGFNTSENAKANEFNGREANHIIPQVNVRYNFISEEGKHIGVWTHHLGDSSREISLNAGQYGNYEIDLNYDQISRFQFNDLTTPFSGVKSSDLTLTSAGTSTADVRQDRYRFNAKLNKVLTPKWLSIVDFKLENKTGLRMHGAAVYPSYTSARSVMLPVPIDQTTQLLKLGIAYQSSLLQMEAGYKGSFYKNEHDFLIWENPHSLSSSNNATVETDRGRIALAPDNQYHQLYVLGALRPKHWIKMKGQIAAGRMLQNEDFTDYTVNSALTNPDLPRKSLDGQINTLQGNFRGSALLSEDLILNGNLFLDRKDNKTPRHTYTYVTTDTLASGSKSRTNLPYGYRKYGANMSMNYHFSTTHNFNVGYEYLQQSRTFSEVAKTKNHKFWLKDNFRVSNDLNLMINFSRDQRSGSNYSVLNFIQPAQNPLMRKYNLADRERYQLGGNIGYGGIEDMYFDFYLNYSADDYTESKIGLVNAKDLHYGVDVSTMLSEDISLHTFLSQEHIKSKLVGAETSTWEVESKDSFTVLGVGLNWDKVRGVFDLAVDYYWAFSLGETTISETDSNNDLPELETDRHTLEFSAKYTYDEEFIIKAAYYLEIYDESDWHVDNFSYNANSSVIGLGREAFSYTSHFITASVIYSF